VFELYGLVERLLDCALGYVQPRKLLFYFFGLEWLAVEYPNNLVISRCRLSNCARRSKPASRRVQLQNRIFKPFAFNLRAFERVALLYGLVW